MKYFITLISVGLALFSNAQTTQTATIMQYNLLNYRNSTSSCTNSNNDPSFKETNFKTIIKHVNPDIICCNEIGNNFGNANKLITNALNTDGVTKYKQCNFSATSGSNLTNMLFYNQEKFGLEKQDKIESAPNGANLVRLVDVYYLYFKEPNLGPFSDTTFLVFFVGHLKAGQGGQNETQRKEAAEAVMEYIEDNTIEDNYFLAGDLNLYGASEPAYQEFTVTPNDDTKFYDPLNASGEWNNNSNFAFLHTQSTRTSGSCFSTGGMDDRFDFILMSKSVKDGLHNVEYINNSYRALGQDGNRFNGSVSSPSNSSEPTPVISALYNVSDHLPTLLNIAITEQEPNSTSELDSKIQLYITNPVRDVLKIRLDANQSESINGKIYSITGNAVLDFDFEHHNGTLYKNIDMSTFQNGIYILKIKTKEGSEEIKKLLKI